MPYDALPTEEDVTTMLGALSPAITLPDGFDVQAEIDAAVTSWNSETRYRPFFQATETPTDRTYDPPGPDTRSLNRGGSCKLLLGNGLISCESLTVGVDPVDGSGGTELTLGSDYFLCPANARVEEPPQPYTEIQFSSFQRGLPQSIVISGVWGYCIDEIPADAWKAIRDLAAANCLQTFREGLMTGLVEWSEADIHERYGEEMLEKLGDGLRARAMRALTRYRLLSY